MSKTFSDYGIEISAGQNRAVCPECSPLRKKQNLKDLAVDYDKGVWFCHHCGWSGGLSLQYEPRPEKKTYRTPAFVPSEDIDAKVVSFFAKRGISKNTLTKFHIKSGMAQMPDGKEWKSTNTIQFPFYFGGAVVNVKYRTGDKRFRQEKNAKKCFYNIDMAQSSASDTLVICEGEMDCLSLYEAGIDAVVSVPDGAPSGDSKNFTTKFAFMDDAEDFLKKFKYVVLAVDTDEPGQRLEEELASRIGLDKCKRVAYPPNCKDANDILVNFGAQILKSIIDNATLYPVNGTKSVQELARNVLELRDKKQEQGYSIGWEKTSEAFNLSLGQMTVVTGIPSHGKSTFIDALRLNMYMRHLMPSAVYSPENYPVENHLATLIEMAAQQSFHSMSPELIQDYLVLLKDGLYFVQPESDADIMSVDMVLSRMKSLILRHGVKIVVIDPWNEIDHAMGTEREDLYLSKQLAKIRRFARVNNVHVFLIAHPTKLQKNSQGEYDAPTAYDIAGGAMWRNKADNILCVHRPDVKTSDALVFVQKVRFRKNGKAGEMLKFNFDVTNSNYYQKM